MSTSKDARRELKAARRDLERVSKRSKDETLAYHRANARVIRAERAVPWWRR